MILVINFILFEIYILFEVSLNFGVNFNHTDYRFKSFIFTLTFKFVEFERGGMNGLRSHSNEGS